MILKMLRAISNAIGEYSESDSIDDIMNNKIYQEVAACYNMMKSENQINELYKFLKDEYKNDEQVLCIIYSILYEITQDDLILEAMYDLLIEKEYNLFLLNSICYQLTYKLFIKLTTTSFYEKKMKMHNKMLKQLKNLVGCDTQKLPISDRDKKRVLIVTDQLISLKHAPSAIVYQVSTILKKYFGFQVQVVCMQTAITGDIENYWINPRAANGMDIFGGQVVKPYDVEIPIYYMPMKEKNIEQIQQLYTALYQMKPIFSWYIGGESIVGDFIGQMTTSLSMPCNNGYGISNADFMISYKNDGSQAIKEQERYLTERNQSLLYLNVVSDHRENYTGRLTREAIGASQGEFLIAIVGNRLQHEISEEFLAVLSEIVDIKDNVKYVFCGDISKNRQQHMNEILGKNQYYLGFRNDLIDAISICDLMINPPRVGGGGSAVMAIAMGVPVMSLKHCDVSMVIDENMCCDSIEEYAKLAKRYIIDEAFRVKQSNRVKGIYEARGVNQFPRYLGEMLGELNQQAGLGLLL